MIFEAIHEFLGGRHVISIVSALYISDITTPEQRTLRINMLSLLELVGSGIGTFMAGFILDAKNIIASPNSTITGETEIFVYNGFTSVYTIGSILIIGCMLQIIF